MKRRHASASGPEQSVPSLLRRISRKDTNLEQVARQAAGTPAVAGAILEGLKHDRADIRYRCAKALRFLSFQNPEALYPHLDVFIRLLDGDSRILRWEGIHVIGNLAVADRSKTIDRILDRYLAPICGPALIDAANTIQGATRIALAKPYLAERIAGELLKVEQTEYETPECRSVALGHVLHAFSELIEKLENSGPIVALARRHLRSPRNSNRRKAAKLLKRVTEHKTEL